MLSKLIGWLSRRFPEQCVVTKQDYTDLRQEVASYNVLYQSVNKLHEDVESLKKQVRELNNINGFISTQKGSFRLER